jgi:ABC-type amino acid transport substrate-binding protein
MLSMFTVTGQVMKTFIQEGKTDKQTGEIDESSIKVQILGEMPVKGGDSRLDLITLTVENEKTYSDLKGKRIRVPLGFFAPSKGQIIYFIPKGSSPELLVVQNG